MRKLSCQIGIPISANEMYVPINKGQLVKSKKYREWIDKNIVILKENMSKQNPFLL